MLHTFIEYERNVVNVEEWKFYIVLALMFICLRQRPCSKDNHTQHGVRNCTSFNVFRKTIHLHL